jgi:hypothetical protein
LFSILNRFSGFANKALERLGPLGAQLSLWFAIELSQAGFGATNAVNGLLNKFAGFAGKTVNKMGPLASSLITYFSKAFANLNLVLPGMIEGTLRLFNNFGARAVNSMGDISSRLIAYISSSMELVRRNVDFQISLTANAFRPFGQRILEAILSGASAGGGDFSELGKRMFNSLVSYLNDKVIKPIREYRVPTEIPFIGNSQPFANLTNMAQILHQGGIVGSSVKAKEGSLRPDEVSTILQKGEGVLPLKAMSKIGPKAFELLRRGMIGDVVAMAAAGKVMTSMPRITPVNMPSNTPNNNSGSSGDVYISVDTFIGQEEWFKKMASQYDMKVTARSAKNNGSQKRVISSYNENERNKYR